MAGSAREVRAEMEAVWLEKLHEAEQRYQSAIVQTQKIQAELASMPQSDGDLALERAVKIQNEALNEYARILRTFTRLTIYGEQPPGEGGAPAFQEANEPAARNGAASAARPRAVRDFDIQTWVYEHHGFVPHPSWIAHCKELELGAPVSGKRPAWQECPADKRAALRQAFVALGMLDA